VHASQEVLVVGNRHKAKITGCRLRGVAVGFAFHIRTEAIAYKNKSLVENHRSDLTITIRVRRSRGSCLLVYLNRQFPSLHLAMPDQRAFVPPGPSP
jgi:hypothetical protein